MTENTQRDESFLWGVATSGYQTEGGFNGPGEPQNNWSWAEQSGAIERSGIAGDFWRMAEADFERCQKLGLSSFRLGVEWSRVQPIRESSEEIFSGEIQPPPFDEIALARYAEMIVACRDRGLEPVITFHHFVHPAWLGSDPWLKRETLPLFVRYVETVLNRILDAWNGRDPLTVPRIFVTINEPNMLAFNHYLSGLFPSKGARGLQNTSTALALLLEAHVLAYQSIHRIYRERGFPLPQVGWNSYCSDFYWADQAWFDLFFLGGQSISRHSLQERMRWREIEFEEALLHSRLYMKHPARIALRTVAKRLLVPWSRKLLEGAVWGPLIELLRGMKEPPLDYLGYDYYDPFIAHILRVPRLDDVEFRPRPWHGWTLEAMTSKWWDWKPIPEGMIFFSRWMAKHRKPLIILENGMAYRHDKRSGSLDRKDGLRRLDYLRDHLEAVRQIRAEGLPLVGYYYWSLVDNFEWGTYAARFGLLGRGEDGRQRHEVNSFGENASEFYSQEIQRIDAFCREAAEPLARKALVP